MLTVPQRYKQVLSLLRDLPDADADAFTSAVCELPPFLSLEVLGERLLEQALAGAECSTAIRSRSDCC